MKKLALILTALFLLGVAAPAMAQTGVTAKVTNPNDGQSLSGSVSVSGNGTAASGVKTIKLFVEDNLVASEEPSNIRQNIDVGYSWDTTTSFAGGISRNGWYQVRVEVTAHGGATDTSKVNVMVDNAPRTPTGFDSYVQDETISLEWAPNPEPDIIGYRIESAQSGSWNTVTEVTGTSFSVAVQPGTYQYRVSALRSSPSLPNGKASAPTEATTLTIQSPEAGGSAGGAGGTGGGRGATGGGDPRVYGRDGASSTKDVKATARAFSSGGISFGGLSLPGQAGLPSLPGAQFEWGTYKERLPYSLPQGGIPLDAAPPRLAALSTTRVIPMDALRWVGAGALLITLAMMLQFIGWRAETVAKLGSEGAAALKISFPKLKRPAVSFKDAHVLLRRLQDRVRTTWKETRGG